MSKNPLNTESYKGVRDFFPEEMYIQNYIFDVMRETAESYGYVEYNASILENAELYKTKSGEEIVNEQTYTFIDRGEREVTLRPEMTPTLARMIAARKRDYTLPIRWYSIPNVFRYERPQKGRLREHWQLNADIFGVERIEAEIEIISLAYSIMKNFGFTERDFEIRINSRKLLSKYLDKRGLDERQKHEMQKLLDKKNKINNFSEQAEKICGKSFEFDLEANDEVKKILELLREAGIGNARFEKTLVRGFDYYTDIVFEVFDTNKENNRSLFGGGRYDNLLEVFDEKLIPAVGFGMGDVTIRDALESRGLLPEYRPPTHLYICTVDEQFNADAQKLARNLRAQNIKVAVDLSGKHPGDQIKKADKDKIPFIICIGEDEKETGTFKIKELKTGNEESVKKNEISPYILKKLRERQAQKMDDHKPL